MDMLLTTGPVRGVVRVPGDKSVSHRVLLFGALAAGVSHASNVADSADCRATRRIITALGATVRDLAPGDVEIEGQGLDHLREPADVLDAANSGTTTRLMLGVLASRPFYAVLSGDRSLRARPMARVVEPLTRMGATFMGRDGGRLLPLSVRGGPLHAIDADLPVASAQLKSAVLLAALAAYGSTRVREPAPSRDHTERMLTHLGVDLRPIEGGVVLYGPARPRPFKLDVPGDISSAAFFLAAAVLAPESTLTLPGVGVNPTRTGIIDVLRAMGATIEETSDGQVGPEPIATLTARSSALSGVEVGGDLIPRLLDEAPLIALLATQARGRTVIRDAAELRVKESDRIAATAHELQRLGATIATTPDGLIIDGPTPLRGARCESHGDHRIAMMVAVAALIAEGETFLDGAECVEVSYPGFFEVLNGVAAGRRQQG